MPFLYPSSIVPLALFAPSFKLFRRSRANRHSRHMCLQRPIVECVVTVTYQRVVTAADSVQALLWERYGCATAYSQLLFLSLFPPLFASAFFTLERRILSFFVFPFPLSLPSPEETCGLEVGFAYLRPMRPPLATSSWRPRRFAGRRVWASSALFANGRLRGRLREVGERPRGTAANAGTCAITISDYRTYRWRL